MTDSQRCVVIDGRRFDVAVISVDSRGLHVALHVRDSFAQLCASTDGTEGGALRALDLNHVSRNDVEIHVIERHDIEIVLGGPFYTHSDAAPVIEKLRLAAGLIRS